MRRRFAWVLALLPPLASACPIGDLTSGNDARADAPSESAPSDAGLDGEDSSDSSDAPDVAPNSITFVQATGNYNGGVLTMPSPVLVGNAVIVVVANSSSAFVMNVTDAHANTYTQIFTYKAQEGGSVSMFVAFDVQGGTQNISVIEADGGAYIFYGAEYAGLTKFDAAVTGFSTSTATDGLVSPLVNVTASPELLFAYAEATSNLNPGTGFANRSGFDGNTIEDRIVSVPGMYSAKATNLPPSSDAGPPTGDILLACFH